MILPISECRLGVPPFRTLPLQRPLSCLWAVICQTGRIVEPPSFLVAALKDPLSENLDRIQIIKGWMDSQGQLHERVYDVAFSDGQTIGADGRCKTPVGNTVDIGRATWSNTIGDSELIAVWKDPEFEPEQPDRRGSTGGYAGADEDLLTVRRSNGRRFKASLRVSIGVIPHCRAVLKLYVTHHHHESNHQGRGNVLLFPIIERKDSADGPIRYRERRGGRLRSYDWEAARVF